MKQIFLILITASLLFACDETKDEQDIINTFIGSAGTDGIKPEVYNDIRVEGNAYLQEFNSAATSDWQSGKGINDGTYSVSAGNYVVTASNKGQTGVWKDLPAGVSFGDYQIDISLKHVSFGSSNTEQALLYGITNNGNSFYFFGCNPATTTNIIIGKDDSNWYKKQRDLDLNAYHLYSVRKYNEKLYFFIDKSFVYSCTDFNMQNYGFYVGKNGIMHVDYVSISYLF